MSSTRARGLVTEVNRGPRPGAGPSGDSRAEGGTVCAKALFGARWPRSAMVGGGWPARHVETPERRQGVRLRLGPGGPPEEAACGGEGASSGDGGLGCGASEGEPGGGKRGAASWTWTW